MYYLFLFLFIFYLLSFALHCLLLLTFILQVLKIIRMYHQILFLFSVQPIARLSFLLVAMKHKRFVMSHSSLLWHLCNFSNLKP